MRFANFSPPPIVDILARGWRLYGDEEKLKTNPIRHLNEIYVRMNVDPEQGGQQTTQLETDTSEQTQLWSRFRYITLKHLQKTYARMNVLFTSYEYESDYVQSAHSVVNNLLQMGLAVHDDDGVVCLPVDDAHSKSGRIVLLKSNKDTLYLTRDLAAALSRQEQYEFDRIHYVVEIGQQLHFKQLQTILHKMGYAWADPNSVNAIESAVHAQWHIPFGRVHGMSSRRGQGLFLADILDNARVSVMERMRNSRNTRVFEAHRADGAVPEQTANHVADQLAVSCLVVEMLRKSRLKPIRLDAFLGHSVSADTTTTASETADQTDMSGFSLQYCHARLCSLIDRAAQANLIHQPWIDESWFTDLTNRLDKLTDQPQLRPVDQPAFVALLQHLDSLSEVMQVAYEEFESAGVVQYTTRLTSLVNVAWKQLPVLTPEISDEEKLLRITLFLSARHVLAFCMRLLGIEPLRAI